MSAILPVFTSLSLMKPKETTGQQENIIFLK